MGVRGFAPSMAGGPCRPRSSSKIIAPNRGILGLGDELRKCVRTFHGRFVSCGNGEGIEVLAEPIFVRGLPLLWKRHCRPCAWLAHLASSSFKIIAPNRGALVFRNGLRKRVRTSHGRFVLCWERGGDRRIGGANLRKGAALQWKCVSRYSMEVRFALFFMRGGIARF